MRQLLTIQQPELQAHDWPPVPPFTKFSPAFNTFLFSERSDQEYQLAQLKTKSWAEAGEFLNDGLSQIYAYVYGYADSPCYLATNIDLEIALGRAKILLDDYFINHWLPTEAIPSFTTTEEAYEYLTWYVESNIGVGHDLYVYLRDKISSASMREFLRMEVCRNEIVDDEVSLLVCGMQGNVKRMTAANLWDECGNGDLTGFHTYWLRLLLEKTDDWNDLITYRMKEKPWFSSITSNIFNVLLTRPGYKYRAYGCFTTTEAWVEPHFEKLMQGLKRVELAHPDIEIYFSAHRTIDPFHTQELLDGIHDQIPALTLAEMREIISGAHAAVAAGVSQYQEILDWLYQKDQLSGTLA